jgi:DNA-binding IclR family transcriptional regulator
MTHDYSPLQTVHGRQIGKSISIVDAIVSTEEGLGISDLARKTDLAKSTTARILTDLVDLGVLVRVRQVYLPGPRLLTMAHHLDPPGTAARSALIEPHLARLRDETGLATAFSILRYGRVRVEFVQHVPATATSLATVPRWPLAHNTVSGKVLLAYTPQAERPLIRSAAQADRNGRRIIDPDGLTSELGRIRDSGLSYSDSEYASGMGAIAVPVLGHGHRLLGVMAVCGGYDDIVATGVQVAVRRAALATSATLGRPPDLQTRSCAVTVRA